MKIALIAACDRNNYGDILLPYITKRFIMSQVSADKKIYFDYFALSHADLTSVGGKITEPLFEMDDKYEAIIVSGGEVMSARYWNMLMNLELVGAKRVCRLFNHRFESRLREMVARMILNGKSIMPWIVSDRFSCPIFYNSVSGYQAISNKRGRKAWEDCIFKAALFSVRDEKCLMAIKEDNSSLDVQLVPDTAILMDSLFSSNELNEKMSKDNKKIFDTIDSYYVIQCNYRYGKDLADDIVDAINLIFEETSIMCVLLPIGRAKGHEDQLILKTIKDRLDNDRCVLVANNNIYETMNIIKKSICFIGTSLHGIVTASAYEVPHTLLTHKAEKTYSYMCTWESTSMLCCESPSDIAKFIISGAYNQSVLKDSIKKMKQYAYDYMNQEFDEIVRRYDE